MEPSNQCMISNCAGCMYSLILQQFHHSPPFNRRQMTGMCGEAQMAHPPPKRCYATMATGASRDKKKIHNRRMDRPSTGAMGADPSPCTIPPSSVGPAAFRSTCSDMARDVKKGKSRFWPPNNRSEGAKISGRLQQLFFSTERTERIHFASFHFVEGWKGTPSDRRGRSL